MTNWDPAKAQLAGGDSVAGFPATGLGVVAAEIGDARFIPYLQVHEYEALVLVDPRRIASIYDVVHAQIEALC